MTELSIDALLLNVLSVVEETRTSAINTLEKKAKDNFSSFLLSMGTVLSSEIKDKMIRQLSSILIKNSLLYIDSLQSQWKNTIEPQEKKHIKMLVLSSLASNFREVRSGASAVIASICKIEQPIMKYWPDLLPSLIQNAFNTNLNLKLSAIETLGYVCEEMTQKDLDNVDKILDALVKNLSDSNEEVVDYVLKAMFHCVHLAKKNFANENELQIIMNAIFAVIQKYMNNDNVLHNVALFFIEFLSYSENYDYIDKYLNQIVEFSFYLINKNSSEKLDMLGFEIVTTLGDEELLRENKSKKYLNRVSTQLLELIFKLVSIPEEDEDESEWNLSKASLYLLSILVRVVDKDKIDMFFSQLHTQIITNKDNKKERSKYWLLLSSCLNTVYTNLIYKLISTFLNAIINDIKPNEDINLQKSASFLLMKITKHLKIINVDSLKTIFSSLLVCLQSAKISVAMNICSIIQNLIKSFGDFSTNKSTNPISSCFTLLIHNLFIPAISELTNPNIENSKLILNRIITIDTLISYTSHDSQELIYQSLIKFLQEIESTTKYDELFSKGINKEKIFILQEYYFTLLRTIFRKYQKPIQLELGKKIWILTELIFKYRKTVFDEANLALASLALNMKNSFSDIFTLYLPYVDFSIKAYNISSLSKSGLVALLNSIRSIGKNITASSDSIIKTLIDVCTSNEVVRANKTIAITCLGEIALTIGIGFSVYLPPVMELLFSACQMAGNIKEDDDEDTIEFVKLLRFELIQTFTCIEFSLDDQTKLLVPYVPHIIKFFKSIVNDEKCQRADILKSMLSFVIDMVSLYGKEVKTLIDINFSNTMIQRLRKYNIAIYEDEINQQEEVLKMLFRDN